MSIVETPRTRIEPEMVHVEKESCEESFIDYNKNLEVQEPGPAFTRRETQKLPKTIELS